MAGLTTNIFEELKKLRASTLNEDIVVDFDKDGEEEPTEETPVEEIPVEEVPVEEEPVPEAKKAEVAKPANTVKFSPRKIKVEEEEEPAGEEEPEGPEVSPEEVEDIVSDEDTYVVVDNDGFIVTCPHCGQNIYLDQAAETIETIEDTETGEEYPVESKKVKKAPPKVESKEKKVSPRHPVKEMMDVLSAGNVRKMFKEGKMTETAMKRYLKEEWGVTFEDK